MTNPRNLAAAEADASARTNSEHFQKATDLFSRIFDAPIPREELMYHLALFMDRRVLSRLLFANEIYELVMPVHGSICEFGVRYGQNLALLTSLRGIHEPYNVNRRIIGFDTFAGFPNVSKEDQPGTGHTWTAGDYGVTDNYESFLSDVLGCHEALAPVAQIKKYELVKGDASITVPSYLQAHQELLVALAYFDFDIYKPTLDVLKAILPRLTRGSVLVFDELNTPDFPGETAALREVLGTNKLRLRHSRYRAAAAYAVFDCDI